MPQQTARVAEGAPPLETVLDAITAELSVGSVEAGMRQLFQALDGQRGRTNGAEWTELVQQVVRPHAVRQLVHRDPLTRRSFQKPRGYPGDAVMLDFVYGLPGDGHEADRLGDDVHRFVVGTAGSRAVRHRLAVLRQALEQAAAGKPGEARALALACGHFREGDTDAVRLAALNHVVAFDQDADSLSTVSETFRDLPVEPVHGSIRQFLGGRRRFAGFDLVYAAGLFDYLQGPTASRLVELMFDAAVPGGRVLFANFTPDTPGVGYMEAMMDWFLVYRDEDDMLALASGVLRRPDLAGVKVWRDPDRCIVYCELTKQ